MQTLVLLLTFNRPDTTAKVMAEVAAARPTKLFIASDGPRTDHPEDKKLVAETRRVVKEAISWECEVHTLFRDDNQGVKTGVVGAIDWFFDHVDEGIVLEDDCVPHSDFFPYCEELLEKYRDDERVWAIQGDNSAKARLSGTASYGFIPYALIWGWATWKRAWEHYDRNLELWQSIRGTREVNKLWPDSVERKIHSEKLDGLLANPDFTWDYQWAFTVSYHRGLATMPRRNLVSNIGWGRADATHTTKQGMRQDAPTQSILPLTHPAKVAVDKKASSDVLNGRVLCAGKYRLRFRLAKKIRRTIRSLSGTANKKAKLDRQGSSHEKLLQRGESRI